MPVQIELHSIGHTREYTAPSDGTAAPWRLTWDLRLHHDDTTNPDGARFDADNPDKGARLLSRSHRRRGLGRTRSTRLRPYSKILRLNIITAPMAAAITDATGIIASGPK
jgi:hypothetical protein